MIQHLASSALVTLLFVVGTTCAKDPPNARWQYHAGEQSTLKGSPHALWLSPTPPDDLDVQLDLAEGTFQVAEFKYGNSGSRRVAVALRTSDQREAELFVDLNRDRRIESSEQIPRKTRNSWEAEIPAEFMSPGATSDIRHEPRTVRFQPGSLGTTLRYQTLGHLAGSLETSAGQLVTRIVDDNANGRFGDVNDILWVDTNRDGRWNRFTERMACKPVLRIGQQRYQLASDERGSYFELRALKGTGAVRLELLSVPAEVVSYQMLLVGRDGTAISLALGKVDDQIPIGKYRIASFTLTLAEPVLDRSWNYQFSGIHTGDDATWFVIARDQTTAIDPLAGLQLHTGLGSTRRGARPGEYVSVSPRLTTAAGLMITNCWRGLDPNWGSDGCGAIIQLVDEESKVLGTSSSGFA